MGTLLLRLDGQLQSWGCDSRFTTRRTKKEPTKSGVVGLIASALGRKRDDPVDDLNRLRFGVRVDCEGKLLYDYQTAESAGPKARKYEIHRYYLEGAVFLAGLECDDDAFLKEIRDALYHPARPLYLGRRCCAPGSLPLFAGIRDAPLLETLRSEPWILNPRRQEEVIRKQKEKKEPVLLRIITDASPEEQNAGVQKDFPVSFTLGNRQYAYRPMKEHKPVVIDGFLKENAGHDVMDGIPDTRRMYLTRMELDTGKSKTIKALETPKMFHGAVEASCPGERTRKLWRIDRLDGRCYLVMVSDQIPHLEHAVEQFGFPDAEKPYETKDYTGFVEQIRNDSLWRFRLKANPTVSKMHKGPERGNVIPCHTVESQKKWLVEKCRKHGFAVESDDFEIKESVCQNFYKSYKDSRPVTIIEVTYEGMLRVTDAGLFRETLLNGVGRKKAYGVGMLSVVKYSQA